MKNLILSQCSTHWHWCSALQINVAPISFLDKRQSCSWWCFLGCGKVKKHILHNDLYHTQLYFCCQLSLEIYQISSKSSPNSTEKFSLLLSLYFVIKLNSYWGKIQQHDWWYFCNSDTITVIWRKYTCVCEDSQWSRLWLSPQKMCSVATSAKPKRLISSADLIWYLRGYDSKHVNSHPARQLLTDCIIHLSS